MSIDTDAPAQPAAKARFGWIAAAKLAVTVALFGILLARTSASEVVQRLGAVGPGTVGIAASILLLTILAVSVRWRIVILQFGGRASMMAAMRYTLIGGFFNQVLPTGMGGDVFRMWYARRLDLSTGRALASVVVDRMFGLFAISAIVTTGIPFVLWLSAPMQVVAAALVVVALLAASIVILLSLDMLERPLENVVRRLARGSLRAMALRGVAGAAWSARSNRAMLRAWPRNAIAIGISIGCQLLVGFVVFLFLRDMGQQVKLSTVLFLFPFVQLLTMLPVSFAGWGLREGSMVVVFRLAGIPAEDALGASILFGLCLFVASLPGLAAWLSLPRLVHGNVA